MRLINRIKAWFRKRQTEKKLRKSGYDNWRQYKHNRDTDVNKYANTVPEFYRNYPYVYAIKDYNHYAFQFLYDCGPGGLVFGYDKMTQWGEEKIRWNYRRDIHRVFENSSGHIEFNDISGSDYIYFAFKHEKDFTHFALRWS